MTCLKTSISSNIFKQTYLISNYYQQNGKNWSINLTKKKTTKWLKGSIAIPLMKKVKKKEKKETLLLVSKSDFCTQLAKKVPQGCLVFMKSSLLFITVVMMWRGIAISAHGWHVSGVGKHWHMKLKPFQYKDNTSIQIQVLYGVKDSNIKR